MLIVKKRPSTLSPLNNKGKKHFFRQKPKDPSRKGLMFLNLAQLLGALNDNVFKFLTMFFIIDQLGASESSSILFSVGVYYVLPFLLFSSIGGSLADRFSKQKLIIYLKFLEVFVMLLGVGAFLMKSPGACYAVLFLMSLQSALFSPPKYSIIPELVSEEKIAKANGLITSSTYIAIIVGSFLASFITQITNRNFIIAGIFCVIIAIAGALFSLGIPKVERQNQKRKLNPIVIQEIYRTLNFCKKSPIFLMSVLGSSFFLFIGAFIQLNIIPYTMTTLNLSDVAGGYLFLSSSIGIVLGAYLSGKSTKGALNLGLSSLASLFIAFFFILLPCLSFSVGLTAICLNLLGFSGGLFVIPFDAYIQTHAPKEKRGEIIACVNFLSFCGVLLAPILLFLFTGVLKLSNGFGFVITGLLNLGFFIYLLKRLSPLFFYTLSRKLILPFYHLKVLPHPIDLKEKKGIVIRYKNLPSLLLIFSLTPKIQLWIPCKQKPWYAFLLKIFKNIRFIPFGKTAFTSISNFQQFAIKAKQDNLVPCLLLTTSFIQSFDQPHELKKGLDNLKGGFHFLSFDIKQKFKRSFKKPWKLSQTSIRLEQTG